LLVIISIVGAKRIQTIFLAMFIIKDDQKTQRQSSSKGEYLLFYRNLILENSFMEGRKLRARGAVMLLFPVDIDL
jgi:hypothetical protein